MAYPTAIEGPDYYADPYSEEDTGDDDGAYCFTCQNLGMVECECGGDICVCMNNGEMPCPDCDRY